MLTAEMAHHVQIAFITKISVYVNQATNATPPAAMPKIHGNNFFSDRLDVVRRKARRARRE